MRSRIGHAIIVGLLGIAPLALAAPATARSRHASRDVRPHAAPGLVIDVSRLRALGLGPTADIVQAVLAGTLAGQRSSRPGTTLVVRISAISLSAFGGTNSGGGGEGSGFGGASNNDYLEGEALVVGPRGEIVDRLPQLMALPSTSGGAYYLPGSERRRVETLSQDFGLWLKRRLG